MTVVSDASPLIGLAAVGKLDLLRSLYGEVWIPEAVHREAVASRPDAPGGDAIGASPWVRVRPVTDARLVAALAVELDPGEAAAIALAAEADATLLLMDERRGRAVATRMGLRVIGALGTLVEAKGRGLLDAVRPTLDAMAQDAGFRVSDRLYARVLAEVGEDA